MIGFVKVVKCSFDSTTWYYNEIGNNFFIYAIDGDMLIVHHPLFLLTTEESALVYTGPDCNFATLFIHKDDAIPCLR